MSVDESYIHQESNVIEIGHGPLCPRRVSLRGPCVYPCSSLRRVPFRRPCGDGSPETSIEEQEWLKKNATLLN